MGSQKMFLKLEGTSAILLILISSHLCAQDEGEKCDGWNNGRCASGLFCEKNITSDYAYYYELFMIMPGICRKSDECCLRKDMRIAGEVQSFILISDEGLPQFDACVNNCRYELISYNVEYEFDYWKQRAFCDMEGIMEVECIVE